jgi:hypothetical protein
MDHAMRRLIGTTTLVLVLGGCASYTWIKPDGTAEAKARDEQACRAEAHDLAFAYSVRGPGAPWGVPPWQQPGPYAYADPSWQAAAEQRVYERCMRGRGYELVRTDKPR